ncbi:beta-ketoacyl-[acyl-carrier-protein] synthase family protein [Sphingomonas sp. FW199]|uniref:beta-ketoacyl-[acyl-carrier-protein] synthase family protein n=1 Tax=Sphingomonas sp. FW199 TaxID=3400217 RepID=UPI003CF6F10B
MARVAITGLGAVTPAGATAASTWDAVRAGRSAIGPLDCSRSDRLSVKIAAQVRDFDPGAVLPPKRAGMMDRFAQFAVVAAEEAVAHSGLDRDDPAFTAAAVITGIGVGGLITMDEAFFQLYAENKTRTHPLTIPKLMCNAAASQVSMALGTHGITYAVASACASGTHAIGLASQLVRSGAVKVAIAGGTEACITTGTLHGWEALRVLATDTCRPFCRGRQGLVLGEGSGMLVLEDWDHAVARGAPILGEVLGFGANADAGDLTSPDPEGAAAAMALAIKDAGLTPDRIGYINAHGTGTTMNDRVEAQAIHSIFDGHPLPLVSSSKAVLGHGLGAAGAMEAVATVMALAEQIVPPTANCIDPDTDLGIDMVPEGPRQHAFDAALSNSFAFGGLNAVLAFGRA